MQSKILQLAAHVLVLSAMSASAATRFVNVNSGSPAPPYTDWATAAATIQDAVDAAVAGDQILVTNGVYEAGRRLASGAATNRVAVTKPVTVQSVNGAAVTLIQGGKMMRCVYLTNGAALMGFTLTGGAAIFGGGVWCESASAVVSNCTITANSARQGGGAHGGTLFNCTLDSNSASDGGSPIGGGAHGCLLNHCTLTRNSAAWLGGGASNSALNNCTLSGNSAADGGGAFNSTLNNCLLTGNSADSEGGGAIGCLLTNCTLTTNSANEGGGAFSSTLNNCIVYYNSAPDGDNYSHSLLSYSCTTPLPADGIGNLINEPLFADSLGGDLQLQSNSPCINAGSNASAPAGPDLNGNPRLVRGTVDIGAYELPSAQSFISYAWLQQYGLPTDGSADDADTDGDGMSNGDEWRAGTDPTNAQSVLRLLIPTVGTPGVVVSWRSVAGLTYLLERSTDLGAQPPFLLLATDIAGQPDITRFTDTNAVGTGPFFYRVGVTGLIAPIGQGRDIASRVQR